MKRISYLVSTALILILSLTFIVKSEIIFKAEAQNGISIITDPQYLFLRKAPNQSQTFPFDTRDPKTITKGGFEEIINAVGTRGTDQRKLGIAILFDTLDANPADLKLSLQKSLQYSKETKLPILVKFDVINWWNYRSDLWNWFEDDSSLLLGFNPDNINNVEWTGYNVNQDDPNRDGVATKIGWRNWGRQLRVPPHPNLGSQRFRQAQKEVLDQLVPEVKKFYDSLPPEEKYLFGGVTITAEISVGASAFYYPNGNSYYDNCTTHQGYAAFAPTANPRGPCGNDPLDGLNYTRSDFPRLGYNAAKTLGIRTSGALTANDNDEIARNYTDFINKIIIQNGIPSNKISAHTGGSFDGGIPGFLGTYNSSKVNNIIPGWSFYGYAADQPGGYTAPNGVYHPVLSEFMTETINAVYPWAVPEWSPSARYDNKAGWVNSLKTTFNYRNNRHIGVGNWESIFGCVERNPDYSCKVNITSKSFNGGNNAIAAIAEVLNEPTSNYCTVSPSYLLNSQVQNGRVNLTISNNKPNTTTYLYASTSPALNGKSELQTRDLANGPITGLTNYTLDMTSRSAVRTIYVQLVTDGCNNTKKNMSEIFTVNIQSNTTCSRKVEGNANCDVNAQGIGIINTDDFDIWRREYLKELNTTTADFVDPAGVGLEDFDKWRITITSN